MTPHRQFVRRGNAELGSLVLSEQGLSKPDPSMITAALLEGIRRTGLDRLAWTPELRQWQARVAFLRRIEGQESRWPDLSDDGAAADARRLAWSLPNRAHDARPRRAARSHSAIARAPLLGTVTPTRSFGSDISLSQADRTCAWNTRHQTCLFLAVRLQEMFGCGGHAPSRRWENSSHAALAVTGTQAGPDHEGPLQLLEIYIR